MPVQDIESIKQRLREFAAERDWDQFHSPKNLSMALAAEAAEILEHFLWLSEEKSQNLSPETLRKVELELGDVFIYLVRLADRLGINLIEAADRKIEINAKKYPAELVKGSSRKYTEY